MGDFKVVTILCIFDRFKKKKSKLLKNEDEESEAPL